MCTNSTAGNVGLDVVGGVADYFSGGALTPELVGLMGSQVGQYAQAQALNKQDQIAAQDILTQSANNKEAQADVNTTTQKIAASNPAAATASQTADYDKALQAGEQASASASPGTPGANPAYKKAVSGATNTAQDYINNIKSSQAGIMAPTLQRIGENQDIANTASDLGVLGQQSSREHAVSQIQEQGVTENPWLQSVGLLMQGAGMGMGAYQGFTGGSVPWESAGNATSTNPFIQYLNGKYGIGTRYANGTPTGAFSGMTGAGSGVTGAAAGVA